MTDPARDPVAEGVVRFIGWIGILALLAAVLGWLTLPDPAGLGLLGLAGAIGVGGRVLFDLDGLRETLRSPNVGPVLRASARAGVVVLVGAALAAGGHLADRRWDLTTRQDHQPSAQMTAALRAVDERVNLEDLHVTGWFLAQGDSVQGLHRRRFEAQAAALSLAAPAIRIQLRDPSREAGAMEADGASRPGSVVVRFEGRDAVLYAPDETSLLVALRRVALDERRVAVLTVGGGEPEAGRGGREGISALTDRLRSDGFDVQARPHLGDLSGVDVVAVVGRTTALPPDDVDEVARWVATGGGLLVALEAEPLAAATTIASAYGVHAGRPLLDPGARDPSQPLLFPVGPHPFGLGLRAAVSAGTSCALESEPRAGTAAFPVLTVGQDTAAMLLELESGGRVLFVCDSDWARDPRFDTAGNGDFASAAFALLAQRDGAPIEEPSPRPGSVVDPTAPDRAAQAFAGLLPLAALLLAGLLGARRRQG